MNLITHGLIGWCISQRICKSRRDAAIVTIGSIIPDIDSLGVVLDLFSGGGSENLVLYSSYHHVLSHNLLAAAVLALLTCLFSRDKLTIAALFFLQFHLHLFCDLIGAKGPDGEQWPIYYFFPFSKDFFITWSGQWEINAWPNILITGVSLFFFLRQARDLGFSALWYLSSRADEAFINALRLRFPSAGLTTHRE